MNLFDFTYCGDYNRQIVNLAGIVPERWSYSGTEDNGILKGYLEHTSMLFLFPIWFRTGRDGFWTAFIRIII